MSQYWSEFVRRLQPYVPGEQPKILDLIKLNTNENPYPPSPAVAAVVSADECDRLRLYPDPESTALKQVLAGRYELQPEQIFVGNGSDEVLAFSFMAFFKQSKPILFPDITYSFYPVYCNLFDIRYQRVALNDHFEISVRDYAVDNGGIIFPNPNAPTGVGLPLAAIEQVLINNRNSVVVVDEAYIDFGGESAIALIQRYDNLLVVQTLSKSRSLAGLRVGFAMGHPDLIAGLGRVKNSFNSYPVDRLAEQMAIAAIDDDAYFQQTRDHIIRTRDWTVAKLQERGFTVLPSLANFVMARPAAIDAADLFARLREEKILVRYFDQPRIDGFLRITIGSDREMQALIDAIDLIMI